MTRTDPFRPRNVDPVPTLTPSVLPERLLGYLERGRHSLSEPFRGITTDGHVVDGLFPRRSTGVTHEKIVAAANAFLASLDDGARQQARMPIGSEAWREWCNIHPYLMRHGICLYYLSEPARQAALDLLRSSLGDRGFALARAIMHLNEHLRELTGRPDEYGPWYYWLTIFGDPSEGGAWGWQIDGHHLNVSCVLCGDQLVPTPGLFGSEPVSALSGRHSGLRVFADEEQGALALMRSLSPTQQAQATIGDRLPRDVFGSAFADNAVIPAAGINVGALSTPQLELLLGLADTYVARLPNGHAGMLKSQIQDHLADTTFAWIGGSGDEDTFYYRIYSPMVLIEFCHQPGQALGDDLPSRNHIHTMMRTPNGNDYGKALLRQYDGLAGP